MEQKAVGKTQQNWYQFSVGGRVISLALLLLPIIGGLCGCSTDVLEARAERGARRPTDLFEADRRWDRMRDQMRALKDEGRYAEATVVAARALRLVTLVFGQDHPKVGTGLVNLGSLQLKQGDLRDAERLYYEGLAVYLHAFRRELPNIATALHHLAELYRQQGRYELAEAFYGGAYALRVESEGSTHSEKGLYQRVLAADARSLGPDHPEVATTLSNMARLYEQYGLDRVAEPLYRQALAIRERAFGPMHPSVATILNGLGELYERQRLYREAEPLYQQALAIYEHAPDPRHPELVSVLDNYAGLLVKIDRLEDAKAMKRRANEIRAHSSSSP
ncbi:MAG: tetratricopeptide repeat protein [Deltaproteobacteria bacterium]|nr:tetratricopeptide repeat protein [Deltaproteobacteria bacterium]